MESTVGIRRIPRWIGNHQKPFFLLLGVLILLAAGAVTTLIILNSRANSASGEVVYREYQAAVGDLTVGTSESGTISLTRETISFPVDASIESILVKAGTEVKEGDALIQLDPDSVSDGGTASTAKLEEAKLALDKALTEQKKKLEEAKQAYASSAALSGYSTKQLSLEKEEIENSIEESLLSLESAQKELEKYQTLQTTYAADTARLEELEAWMDEAEELKKSYETQLSNYETNHKTVFSRLSALESEMQKAEGDKYDDAKDAYDDYYASESDIFENQTALETKLARYTAEYENYQTAYNDFKETYDEAYDVKDADELEEKLKSLELSVKQAEVKYEKAQNESKLSLLTAEQELQSSQTEISTAQETYDNTVKSLELDVATQQSTYNTLKRQMSDLEDAIASGGLITAPCDGIVSNVLYSDGDDISANQTLLTIMKPTEISMSLSLSEEDITSVKVGQPAEITLTAYEDQSLAAEIDSISTEPARSGSASVSYTVKVKVTEENQNTVYEGMSGEVTLIQKQIDDALYVSNQAVTFENGRSYVLVKDSSGENVKKEVRTGFTNGRYVEILSGLNEGDTVLAESAVSAR